MKTKLTGKRVLVLGAGRTGVSTASVLHRQGAMIRLVDRSTEVLGRVEVPRGVELREEDDDGKHLQGVETVVTSPGIPRQNPTLRSAVARGITIQSELELASQLLECPILAITGTNGKSTTTTLVGGMMREAGLQVFVGGNLGTPLIDAVEKGPLDAAVVEVSSFQLEWVRHFRPRVGVLLNLSPDHLDRYSGIEEYGAAKMRLFAAQQDDDIAVLNRDDVWVWEQRHTIPSKVISFGRDPVEFGTYVDGECVVCLAARGVPVRIPLSDLPLQGEHNCENMMAAVTAAISWGIPEKAVVEGLRSMRSLPHRLELVREKGGVRYFDDSKGTNVGALEKSVSSFPGGVILLAGGYDKGSDFRSLLPFLKSRVRHAIFFGAAAGKLVAQLGELPHSVAGTLAEAVRAAAAVSTNGDVVLLSPGCASFDEFTDYAHRGRCFREVVEAL